MRESKPQQALDTSHGLQINRSYREIGLQLREPFLDDRLRFVCPEDFFGRHLIHVADQRKHAIAGFRFRHANLLDTPENLEPLLELLDVLGVFARTTFVGLPEGLFFTFLNFDDQKSFVLQRLEDLLYRFVHLLAALKTSARSAQTLTQIRQLTTGSLQAACAITSVVLGFLRAVIPQQPIPVAADHLVGNDRQTIHLDFMLDASGSHLLGDRVDVVPANRIGLFPKLLAELLVFFVETRQHRDEASLASDVLHVLATAQLAVGHIKKVASPRELAQQVPRRAMRRVVAGVVAGGREVDRYSSVFANSENEQQLLQVGPMVFAMSVGDG